MRLGKKLSRTLVLESLECRQMMAADLSRSLISPNFAPAIVNGSALVGGASAGEVKPNSGAQQTLVPSNSPQPPLTSRQVPYLPPFTQHKFSVDFQWRMQERTGPEYQFGFAPKYLTGDVPNVREYVNPEGGFEVVLDASRSKTPLGTYYKSVQWTIVSENLGTYYRKEASGLTPTVRLPEGRYSVTLTITNSLLQKATAKGQINVDNILVVSLGDSYASGEGIPQAWVGGQALWAMGGDATSTRLNKAAHRSIYSAPAQAAYKLEQVDPHTSVTFVSAAVTGATLADIYESQVQQVRDLITNGKGPREIDLLFISGGGNDMHFAGIVEELLFHDEGESLTKPELWAQQGLHSLRSSYGKLDKAITANLNVKDASIFVTGYPDPSLDERPGATPKAILDDVVSWEEIDAEEILWARQKVINPLNYTIEQIVQSPTVNWNFVSQIDVLRGHGYSSSDNWVVTWDESVERQGHDNGFLKTMGVMHPNAKGASAMSQRMVDAVFAEQVLSIEQGPRILQVIDSEPPRLPAPFGQRPAPYTIELVFSELIQVSSFTAADVSISGPDGTPGRIVEVRPVSTENLSTRFKVTFMPSKFGRYSLEVGSGIVDVKGNWLDQDQDGVNGLKIGSLDQDVFRSYFDISSAFGDTFAWRKSSQALATT